MKKTTSRIITALAAKGAQASSLWTAMFNTGWKACAPLVAAALLVLIATVTQGTPERPVATRTR